MFELFDFDLPGAVTEQLERRLESMPSSRLTQEALEDLAHLQEEHKLLQGVYQLLLKDQIVYVGKATNVRERLEQHYWKVRGRQKIKMEEVSFRCLVLHGNWSTSANEGLLITHYKAKGQSKWNGSGFGPKDVGKERDGTEPNWFDREYPINADYACQDIPDWTTVNELVRSLKAQLPFTFRFKISDQDAGKPIDLRGVPRTPRALMTKAVAVLGPEWQATIFVSHIVLYQEIRRYQHGEALRAPG